MTTDNSMEAARDFFAENSKPQDLQVHKRKRSSKHAQAGSAAEWQLALAFFTAICRTATFLQYILVVLRQLCDIATPRSCLGFVNQSDRDTRIFGPPRKYQMTVRTKCAAGIDVYLIRCMQTLLEHCHAACWISSACPCYEPSASDISFVPPSPSYFVHQTNKKHTAAVATYQRMWRDAPYGNTAAYRRRYICTHLTST